MSQPPRNQRRPALAATPLSHLPSIVDPAPPCGVDPAPSSDARRPVQQAAPSAQSALLGDPGDLVARALAVLAEETGAWHARRAANLLRERPQ